MHYSLTLLEKINILPASSSYTATSLPFASFYEDVAYQGQSLLAKIVRRILLLLAQITSGTLMYFLDRPPAIRTTLPIGWLAVDYKLGFNKICRSHHLVRSFIEPRFLNTESYCINKGRIIPFEL